MVDHYDNPRNVGSFNKGDVNVGTGLVGAPACGDVMKLQIKVCKAQDRLRSAPLSHALPGEVYKLNRLAHAASC